MDTRYEIVKYSPEFKKQIVELQTHLWSPDLSVNAAHLEWKYEHNPYMDTPIIYMALCEGKVVGMRGIYGAKWQTGNPPQTLPVLCIGDAVVAPEHRNKGLFAKITLAALNDLVDKGYIYVFSTSPGPVTQLSSLKIGWRSVGPLQTAHWQAKREEVPKRLRKFARGLPLLASTYRRLQSYSRKLSPSHSYKQLLPFDVLDRSGVRQHQSTNPYIFVERAPRPEAMAELVGRIDNDRRIRHVRDQQYFAWRFNNPLSIFRFLFWEDAKMEGYLVLQTSVKDKLRISIVDMEATNLRVLSDLLHAAISLGNFDNLNTWSATLSNEIKVLLKDIGFNFVNETGSITRQVNRPTVLIRPVRQEMLRTADWIVANARLLDLANWDLRMIYSDAF